MKCWYDETSLAQAMSVFHDSDVYRSILESLPTGLCIVDMEKRIVLWSDGAERITGRLRHEVVGHSCVGEALLHCDQPGCEFCGEDCPLARAIKTARPNESIGFLHHKKGHEVPVRLFAVPVHNAHGSIIGAVETFEDQPTGSSPDGHEEGLSLPGCVDDETGLASQIMMQSHVRETLGTFHEVHVPFGVLCFRLEGLDRFRSSFGPEAASSLLRVIARTLESALWKTDFVGRWSENEFLVILNGCREEALHSVRERIRRMLANDSIEWWGERRSLPVSVGQSTAQEGDSIESLMQRVQKSLASSLPQQARGAAASAPDTSSGNPAGS
jgi:diguanylate cyclase (GGDEF)-like protein/PAS domain S-box-containing protein